ncbi:MAG: large subunit ribosomal protein L13 [Patescibacteria group bacterium]|jgi:large subunit ribosomal protein L13
MKTFIYDGNGAVMGRLASQVAKDLLKGNEVFVVNSEAVVISGKKELIVERILEKRRMGSGGSLKGPTYIRQSDRLLKRMIRGMLPWDRTKGREAYKRLRCFVGNGELTQEQAKNATKLDHNIPEKHVSMHDIVRSLT